MMQHIIHNTIRIYVEKVNICLDLEYAYIEEGKSILDN